MRLLRIAGISQYQHLIEYTEKVYGSIEFEVVDTFPKIRNDDGSVNYFSEKGWESGWGFVKGEILIFFETSFFENLNSLEVDLVKKHEIFECLLSIEGIEPAHKIAEEYFPGVTK